LQKTYLSKGRKMLIEIPEMKNKHQRVWDTPVPIVKVDEELYRVYMLDEIGHPQDYAELVELMQDLDETVTIEWYLNSPGGVLNTATMLLDAMITCKAKLVGKLSGLVASAATMLTLGFDEVKIAPYIEFLVHNYSGGLSGKGNELRAQQAFVEKETAKLFKEVYKGFLTTAEIKRIMSDQDMWMSKDEIEKRLAKRKELLNEK